LFLLISSLFIVFELLTPQNFRVKSSDLGCVVQKNLANEINHQIDQKSNRSEMKKPKFVVCLGSILINWRVNQSHLLYLLHDPIDQNSYLIVTLIWLVFFFSRSGPIYNWTGLLLFTLIDRLIASATNHLRFEFAINLIRSIIE